MQHMRDENVPIIPTVIVSASDFERLGVEGIAALVQHPNTGGAALTLVVAAGAGTATGPMGLRSRDEPNHTLL